MSKGFSEIEARKKIETKLPDHIKFLKWEGDIWISARNTRPVLYCTKHKEIFSLNFRYIVDILTKDTIGCPKCINRYSYTGFSISKAKNGEQVALNFINSIIPDHINFLGWKNNWESNRKSIALFYCNKHKTLFEIKCRNLRYHKTIKCPKCSRECMHISKYEEKCFDIILSILKDINLIERQSPITIFDKLFNECRKIIVDFYIKELNLIIEYDGEQHYNYIPFFKETYNSWYYYQVARDNCLNNYCKENNINLLRIPYVDNNRLEEVIEKYFTTGEDITTKIQPKLLPIKYEEKKLWM